MADLAVRRQALTTAGTQLAFVHMGTEAQAAEFFGQYHLVDVPRVSDPAQLLYRAFALRRTTLFALFDPKLLRRGWDASVGDGHRVGRMIGDGFQMPGMFLIENGLVSRSFRHEKMFDRPDYQRFACGDGVCAVG